MPDPNDQNNQDQPPVQPVFADPTQMGNVVPPPANAAPPSTQTTVDVTAGNQTTVAVASPETTTTVSMKPTRGKVGPKGIIATVFGILLLAGAVVAGTTLVQQNQDIRERASGGACLVCSSINNTCVAGSTPQDECDPSVNECNQVGAVCGGQAGTGPDECLTSADCSGGRQCVNTQCVDQRTACQSDQALCGDFCANLTSDINNCGGCGIRCESGQRCTGGRCEAGANTCTVGWNKWYCQGRDKTEGSGCQENLVGTFNSQPSFDTSFCGVQQIDCIGNTSLQFQKTDYSACEAAPSPGAPPPPKSDCPSPGSCWDPNTRKCDIDKNNPDCSPIGNCGGAGLESGGSCGGGQICCRPKGTSNPKPRCLGIGIQVKVNNAFVKATTELVSALKAGDVIRLTASGGGTDLGTGDCRFDKARFAINGAAPVETTAVNRAKDRFGRDRCTYYYDYTIPAGVTRFSFDGDVHYGPSNVWK